MAKTVDTGWRKLTPGCCSACGFDDGWNVDGRGTVYCDCQTCPECGEFGGHACGCPEQDDCPHWEDNQGLCHGCGVLLNLDAWETYAGKGAPPPERNL